MASSWPWLALAGLGAFHGLNPAMGWLFAVALGLHRKSFLTVVWALPSIALGHAISIAVVASMAMTAGVFADPRTVMAMAGLLLIGWAIYHPLYGTRHRVRFGMTTGQAGLLMWSFLMATGHGAGLMIFPAVIPICMHSQTTGMIWTNQPIALTLAAVGVHTFAMLFVASTIAIVVYRWIGVAILRTAWLNMDFVWTSALVITGGLLLALP